MEVDGWVGSEGRGVVAANYTNRRNEVGARGPSKTQKVWV